MHAEKMRQMGRGAESKKQIDRQRKKGRHTDRQQRKSYIYVITSETKRQR